MVHIIHRIIYQSATTLKTLTGDENYIGRFATVVMLVVSLQVNIQSIWHEGRRLDQSRASAKQRELHAVQWLVQRMNRQQDHGPSRLEDMFGKQILARAI